MRRFLQLLSPFLLIAFISVALVFGMVLFFYILVFSLIAGTILYVFSWIHDKFAQPVTPKSTKKQEKGRIIDSNDWREL